MAPIKHTRDVFDATKTKETHNLAPHPITGRLIDNHPGTRTIPMKVLVLGVSRTGTMSIYAALEQLVYRPYHMAKAIQAPKSNLDVWREGIEAKAQSKGKPFGKEEFDKVMGEYDACADLPCSYFAEELIEAYPDAKIIVNERDVEEWLVSMGNTAGEVMSWRSWPYLAPWDRSLTWPFWLHAKAIMWSAYHTFDDFSPTSPAREAFFQHYERLREAAPPDRTLEYQVQDGWGPLCDFLGVPVPDGEYPRVNDAKQFIFAHKMMWYIALAKMIAKTSVVTVPMVAVGVAWWYGRIPKIVAAFS